MCHLTHVCACVQALSSPTKKNIEDALQGGVEAAELTSILPSHLQPPDSRHVPCLTPSMRLAGGKGYATCVQWHCVWGFNRLGTLPSSIQLVLDPAQGIKSLTFVYDAQG